MKERIEVEFGKDDGCHEVRLTKRIYFALKHPDCPILCMAYEAREMAKHLATRLCRSKPLPGRIYEPLDSI